MTTPAVTRARAYLNALGPAVTGQNGHDTAFTAACALVRFGLAESEAVELLGEWNQTCQPPWSARELNHKVADAFRKARAGEWASRETSRSNIPRQPRPPVARPAPSSSSPPAADLPEPIAGGAVELLRAAFETGEGVRIAQGTHMDDWGMDTGQEHPRGQGLVLKAEEWIARLEAVKGDPNRIYKSMTGAGVYIGVNPYRHGGAADADVTSYRHVLIEGDSLSVEEQWSALCASGLPITAIIFSGGRSLHAWVRVDARTRPEYDERIAVLMEQFPWADPKNRNPARLSRLPDQKRGDSYQRLLALRIGAPSWSAWIKNLDAQRLGPARQFGELIGLDTAADPYCVIGVRNGRTLRYLCRGKAGWLLGPSGIGKSSLIAQFAVAWAQGTPAFGISPVRPLRSLIVQAENDDYDLAEMVQGIARAYSLEPGSPAWEAVNERVTFRTETRSVGQEFVGRLHRMIDVDEPDVVWVDPLLSFAGIDVAKQDQVTQFLRGQLNAVLEATGVVLIGVHHTGKPRNRKETQDWTAIDWAYSGLGSSELVNWARAVMLLRPVDDSLFQLLLAKRGRRAGACHPDNTGTNLVWLRHSADGIRWDHVQPPPEADQAGQGPVKPGKAAKEAPKSKARQIADLPSIREVLLAVPAEGESARALGERVQAHARQHRIDASLDTCRRAVLPILLDYQKLVIDSEGVYKIGPNA